MMTKICKTANNMFIAFTKWPHFHREVSIQIRGELDTTANFELVNIKVSSIITI
jgi:hypothetical protein